VTIAGGRGWLGSSLQIELVSSGHGVRVLCLSLLPLHVPSHADLFVIYQITNISRSHMSVWPFHSPFELQWYQVMGEAAVPDCDALVQITGPSYLVKHHVPTKELEQEHYEARGGITELLATHVKRTRWPPLVFVQVSNAGIYPARFVS